MKKPKLSIIIPCYNEEKNIPLILTRFKDALKNTKYSIELILVDNNSKDKTSSVLKKELAKKEYAFARSEFQLIQGYGSAIKKGLTTAKGEYICWTHADLQTDPKDTIKALEIILKQKNPAKCYVKGNRKGRSLFDTFFTIGMSFFETSIFLKIFWDINAQPNLFHKSLLKKFKNIPDDFSLDLYAYYIAKKANYKIIRFKVIFPKRLHGESSWNTSLSAKWKFIKRTISFSFKLRKEI